MKKIVKIAVIAVVVILAIALIAPAALRGKIADIVKREANAMLAARLDFEKLDVYKRQVCRITDAGRDAFAEYVEALQSYIKR